MSSSLPQNEPQAPARTARVLVVDDERDLRELLVDALGDLDVEIASAASGREAIEQAAAQRPDLVVTDLRLGDCTGLDVIDRIRSQMGDVPAVVITGHGDARTFSEASRRRPVEMMIKPLDIHRLRSIVQGEITRLSQVRLSHQRVQRLRRLARTTNLDRKNVRGQLESTCADLAGAYRTLSGQVADQQLAINYQRDLLAAKTDDDVFRVMFRLFARRSGPVHGVAMVCDAEAQLQIVGRFGVPNPDCATYCEALARPMIDQLLKDPKATLLDAGEHTELFDPDIRKYLCGVSILTLPLMPSEGEMIGIAMFYRKGEQPFTDEDVALGEMISLPTAIAVRRND